MNSNTHTMNHNYSFEEGRSNDMQALQLSAQSRALLTVERASRGLAVSGAFHEVEGAEFVRILSQIEPISRADLLAKGLAPIMLADLDGTLTRDPSGSTVVEEYIRRGLVLDAVLPAIKQLLPRFGGTAEGEDPSRNAQALMDQYLRWVREDKATDSQALDKTLEFYAFCAYVFAGRSDAWLQRFAIEVFDQVGFWGIAFKDARPMIKILQARGIETAIISASPHSIAKVLGAHFGVPEKLVRGVPVATDEAGNFLPRLGGTMPFREGKVLYGKEIIAQQFGAEAASFPALMAIGDTPSKTDGMMLEAAHLAIVAEPQTAKDYDRAKELSQRGHGVVVVDFRETADGRPAGRFDLRGAAYRDPTLAVV